jgi:hypothetical protein
MFSAGSYPCAGTHLSVCGQEEVLARIPITRLWKGFTGREGGEWNLSRFGNACFLSLFSVAGAYVSGAYIENGRFSQVKTVIF